MNEERVMQVRDEISRLWHRTMSTWHKQPNSGFRTLDHYFAFCAAKDWIQDTAEAIFTHRKSGFSSDRYQAYIELWGVLQALFVQQDAIEEMFYAVELDWVPPKKASAWRALRDLRNLVAGHPTRQGNSPVRRSVTPRAAMSYSSIGVKVYEQGRSRSEQLNIGDMIDAYDDEAAAYLQQVLEKLEAQIGSLQMQNAPETGAF